MDVKEVLLPGVGLRYEFTDHKGDRIGIIARRSGDFDVVVLSTDVEGYHQPAGSAARGHLLDAAGDGVDAVPAAVGAENLGCGFRVPVTRRLQPHPA